MIVCSGAGWCISDEWATAVRPVSLQAKLQSPKRSVRVKAAEKSSGRAGKNCASSDSEKPDKPQAAPQPRRVGSKRKAEAAGLPSQPEGGVLVCPVCKRDSQDGFAFGLLLWSCRPGFLRCLVRYR